VQIPAELKLVDTPRGCRPRCGATTRAGHPCRAQALVTGFCAVDSGIVTGGPRTPEARERQAERARGTMNRLWATRWAEGRPLSTEGRERIVEAQKRRSADSRSPSEQTRRKISEGRKRFETAKREALTCADATNVPSRAGSCCNSYSLNASEKTILAQQGAYLRRGARQSLPVSEASSVRCDSAPCKT
jgi:hypothetical protein